MITVKLKGGLGNQMFQYATGKALAHINNTDLGLELSSYSNPGRMYPYPYSLNKFNISHKKSEGSTAIIIREQSSMFNKDLIKQYNLDVVLDGYWQTEKYFKPITDAVRNSFSLKVDNVSAKLLMATAHIIGIPEHTFVHIRRNERVNDSTANNIYGVVPASYYEEAMSLIKEKHPSATFIGVTDDKEWTRKNIDGLSSMIDDFNDYESKQLIRRCRHAIIANSSFSWWGAWLISNKNKMVIAPKPWTKKESYYSPDIYPEEWIKLNPNYE